MVTTEGFDELLAAGRVSSPQGGMLTLPRPEVVAERGPTPVSALPRRRDLRRAERNGRGTSPRVPQAPIDHPRVPEAEVSRREPGPRRSARRTAAQHHEELPTGPERNVPQSFVAEPHPQVRRTHFSAHEVANRLPRRPVAATRPPVEQVPLNEPITGAQPWWRTGEVSALFDPATFTEANPYRPGPDTGPLPLDRVAAVEASVFDAPPTTLLRTASQPRELQAAPLDAVRDIAAGAGAGIRVLDGAPQTRRSRRVAAERAAWVTDWKNNPRKRVVVRSGLLLGLVATGGTGVLTQRAARAEVRAEQTKATIWSGTLAAAQTVADATDRQVSNVRIGQELTTEAATLAASQATAQVVAVQSLKNAADKAEADRLAAIRAKAEAAAARARAEAKQRAIRDVRSNPKAYARVMLAEHGWSSSQFSCLDKLWTRESGWNYKADNPTSSAYGIPQALPGSKMVSEGSDWKTNPMTQIRWGLDYIADRYGTPCSAWAHSEAKNWY
jgi:hypothetical protein